MTATVSTKSRTISYLKGKWRSGFTYLGTIYPSTETAYNLVGAQTTVSENHDWPNRAATWDIGGGFYTALQDYKSGDRSYHLTSNNPGGIEYYYDGPQVAYSLSGGSVFPRAVASTDSQLDAYGTTAIARTIPTNPISQAAQFLGELVQDVPAVVGHGLVKTRCKEFKEFGSEYLNIEFGWIPFLSDLSKMREATRTSSEVLEQFARDSGRNVRKQYHFPVIQATTVENLGLASPTPALPTPIYKPGMISGTLLRTTKTISRRWFSGCYTYYLNPGIDALGRAKRIAQEANRLYGTRLTPSILWELEPWSWAADWMTNTGDIIHNFSAFSHDGLVLRYGYMMEELTIIVTYSLSGIGYMNQPYSHSFSQSFTHTVKSRRKATPYGFGFSPFGFTTGQWAILAALGISRGRGAL